jgi:PST family polysaccharide transporter
VSDTHKQRTLTGVAWNFFKVLGQTLLGVGVNVILARLLPPSDFGTLALAMVFISFAELVSSIGLGPSIVQRKGLTERHLQVATTLSLIMGIALVGLFMVCADSVALFFNEPKLALAIRVLAVSMFFSSIAAPSRGVLIRHMDFRRLAVVDIGAYALGFAAVSITLALSGFGFLSLVIGSVAANVISAVAVLFLKPPRLPLSLAGRESRDLLGFGGGYSLNSTINHLAANVDYLVVGKFLSMGSLGLYTRSYQLVTMPLTKIAATMSSALFPSYAEIQENRELLARAYFRAVNATALATFPILIVCAVASDAIIVGLYGTAWSGAADVFRILCLAGMLKAVFHLAGAVVQATGNIYAEVKCQLVYLSVLTVGCLVAVEGGIEAVGWAVVVGSTWLYLSMARLALNIVHSTWSEFFGAQRAGVVVGLVVAAVQFLVLDLERAWFSLAPPVVLCILLVTSGVTLAAVLLFCPRSIVGDMPSWLANHYGARLPSFLRRLMAR